MTRGTNNAGPAGDKGTSGQNVPKSPKGPKTQKSKFRMESEHDKISKSKLRMEMREDKLNRARKKLEGKKPPKPRGPVRRVLGAAGWSAHGFVHGKIYEVEHENVGTKGAHRSELMGEAVGRAAVHTVKKRIREHPARAVHKAEAQYIKARADYQFRMAAQENPELAKNAVTRYWHKQKLKKQYAKQARQAAKQTAKQGASLIDNLFVQMGVHFISLAEGVDSYLNPDSVNSIIVPITNVMNDQYCYQTSKKIRQVFDYKRRNGQYIGSFAP